MKNNELHLLIRSLSRSEKRYFRLFCTREASGSNYLKLFDAIDAQAEYDEKLIKKRFRGETFSKQLHVTKNYLRKLILKSLRNFHAGISREAEVKDLLRNVEILFNKELFLLCETELKRAERLAREFELVIESVAVEFWKRRLQQTLHPHNYQAIRAVLSEQEKALADLQNLHAYWQLAVDFSGRFMNRQKEEPQHLTLLKTPDNARTLEARVLHYNTLYLQHLQEDRGEDAEQALFTLIAILEDHPLRIREEPSHYVSSINNLASYLVFNKKYDGALALIQKAKSEYEGWRLTSENRTLLKQVLRTYNIELEIYRRRKEGVEKTDFIRSTENFVRANTHKMPKEYLLSFWFQLASIHFRRQHPDQALRWLNLLLNARFRELSPDLQVQAHLLNLMVHLEQKNLFVLRYFVDSTRRFMKKVKEVQPFEEILLKFFTRIGRLPEYEYKEAFRELRSQLFPDESETLIPAAIFDYIDYREWIDRNL